MVTTVILRESWEGPVSGGLLALSVGQVVGRQLLLEIENGDNPPLVIEAGEVTAPRKALRVKQPPEGTRMVCGARSEVYPSYDLELFTDDILRLPVGAASLGPETAIELPALAGVDKLVVAGAIGVLALGLVGLLVRVLRGASGPAGEPVAGSAGAGAEAKPSSPEPEAEPRTDPPSS